MKTIFDVSSPEALLAQPAMRQALTEQIRALLAAEERVQETVLHGSIGEGRSDIYSDIDVRVILRDDVPDRSFAEDIPRLLAPLGPFLIEAWAARMLPDRFVRTMYFQNYPLFWHVDIGCLGGVHGDATDLLGMRDPARFFKTWVETLKGVLRGKATTEPAFVERMLIRWMELPPPDPNLNPEQRLARYLDLCRDQAHAECLSAIDEEGSRNESAIMSVNTLYERCDVLRRAYL